MCLTLILKTFFLCFIIVFFFPHGTYTVHEYYLPGAQSSSAMCLPVSWIHSAREIWNKWQTKRINNLITAESLHISHLGDKSKQPLKALQSAYNAPYLSPQTKHCLQFLLAYSRPKRNWTECLEQNWSENKEHGTSCKSGYISCF